MAFLALFTNDVAGVRDFHVSRSRPMPEVVSSTTSTSKPHKLIGTDWLGHQGFQIGLNYLESMETSTSLTPYGKNYTGWWQQMGLSDFRGEDSTMVLYAANTTGGYVTHVMYADVLNADLSHPFVPVPGLVSVLIVGLDIKLNYDKVQKRTVMTGFLPPKKPGAWPGHGFYMVDDNSDHALNLGFTLEGIVPEGYFQNGYLPILGNKLSVYDEDTSVFWMGLARNATATNQAQFLIVGANVNHKRLEKTYEFPIGDCKFLGAMIPDKKTGEILMQTLDLNNNMILASLDLKKGTCKAKHALKADQLPYAGYMTFDRTQEDTVTTLCHLPNITTTGASTSKLGMGEVEIIELDEGMKMAVLPTIPEYERAALKRNLKTLDSKAADKLAESMAGIDGIPAQPLLVQSYNLKTGETIKTSNHPVCEAIYHTNCPFQLWWSDTE